jgi:iron complex outermembrane recepter protein
MLYAAIYANMQSSFISKIIVMLHNRTCFPRFTLVSCAVGAALLATSAAQAQTTVKVDKVVVTASPFSDQDELQSVQPAVVVGKDALVRNRAASLGDTLSTQAGVQSSSFGPGASRPVIRGLDGPRIKTAENGVGTLDVATISPDHAVSTEVLGARQIEILRGPATLLYGSGAIGGLVNVVTDRIPQAHSDGTRFLFDGRLSSAERTRDFGGQLRGSVGRFALTGEASDRRTDDYETAHGKLANSDTQSRNASLGGSYILANGFIGVGVNRFDSNYGIPSPDATRIDLSRNRVETLGEINNVVGLERIRFSAASNDYKHAEIESSGEVGTVFRNKARSARFDLQTRPLAGWRTVLGADIERAEFSAVGEETIVPLTNTKSHALFAVTERKFGPGRIEIGGRIERVTHSPDAIATQPGRSFSLASGAIGYQWQLDSQSAVSASFSHAERAPAIEELYSNGAHIATLTYDLGNALLAKERSQNFDVSYKLQTQAWSVRASVFRNSVKNFIYGASVDENNDGVADLVNAEGEIMGDGELLKREFKNVNARFTGAELSLAHTPKIGFGFTAMADTVRGVIVSENGTNLPRISPSRVAAKLTWRGGANNAWYTDIGATHVFEQNRVAAYETSTPAYTRLDASVRYRMAFANQRSAEFYVLGRNLGNRDIRVHTSFLKDFAPMPGRSVFLGVTTTY